MPYIINYILKLLVKAIIPAFLIYFSKTDYISDWAIRENFLITSENESSFKFWAFLLGTLIVALIIPIQLGIKEKKLKKLKSIFETVVPILLSQIAEDLDLSSKQLSIRIFRVKKTFFSKDVQLLNKDLEGITNKINGETVLTFTVNKEKIQGVVGKTYSEKAYFVDYNINNANSYDLTPEQVNRIGDVKFCCAAPIFKNKKIKYIISLDSNERVYKSRAKTDSLKRNLVYLCQLFDEFIL